MVVTDTQTFEPQQVDWQKTLGDAKGGRISASGPLPWQVRAERLSNKGGPVSRALWGFSEVFLDTAEVLGRAVVQAPSYLTGSNRQRAQASKDLVKVRNELAGIFTGTGKTYETIDYVLRNPDTVALAAGGVIGREIQNNPAKLVGQAAAVGVMGSKTVNEKVINTVRRVPAFEPEVAVTRATGRAGIVQVDDAAQLVLETNTKNVRLSKAPKGNRVSNVDFLGEGLVYDGVGSAKVPVSASLSVGKGGAKVKNVKVGSASEVNIGYVPEVSLIDETIGFSNKQVKVRGYTKTLITDDEIVMLSNKRGKYPVNPKNFVNSENIKIVDVKNSRDAYGWYDWADDTITIRKDLVNNADEGKQFFNTLLHEKVHKKDPYVKLSSNFYPDEIVQGASKDLKKYGNKNRWDYVAESVKGYDEANRAKEFLPFYAEVMADDIFRYKPKAKTSRLIKENLDLYNYDVVADVYPSVKVKDVKVGSSVRTVSTPVVVKPMPVDKVFSSNAIVVGELEKPVKAAKSVIPKLDKSYSGFVGIAEDGVFSVRRKGINFDDFYKDVSKANKAVKNLPNELTGTQSLKTEKVAKTVTKKAQKPIVSVGKLKSDYQSINFGALEQIPTGKTNIDYDTKNIISPVVNVRNNSDITNELKPKVQPIMNTNNLFETATKRTPAKIIIAPPIPKVDYIPKIKPVVDVKPEITPDIRIKRIFDTSTRTKTNNKPPRKPRRLILPSLSMKPETEIANGFSVFVRKKGVFKLFGSQLKEEQAIALGKTIVRDTSAATFKVPGLTKKSFEEQDFYFGGKGMFIQKRNKRISSAGEIKDITRKGQATIRKKKGKKRGLLSGFW